MFQLIKFQKIINEIEYFRFRISSSSGNRSFDSLVLCTIPDRFEEMFIYSNGKKNMSSALLESLLMTVKMN
jgi:hypothetical protein